MRHTFNDSFFAISNPSVMIRGCRPSAMYRSACFRSSPTNKTTDVVPSPQISSWAVAALAIMTAVGFCICISLSSTFPSLVNLIYSINVSSKEFGSLGSFREDFVPVQNHPLTYDRNQLLSIIHQIIYVRRDTNILIVPRGPRLDLRTSCKPSPALMLTFKASPRRFPTSQYYNLFRKGLLDEHTRDSALGLRSCAADMMN